MKLKTYKPALMLFALLAVCIPALAQTAGALPPLPPTPPVHINTDFNFNLKGLDVQLNKLHTELKAQKFEKINTKLVTNINKNFKKFEKDFTTSFSTFGTELATVFTDVNINTNDIEDIKAEIANDDVEELTKTYSKSYAADANDILDIDNRYGKVTVNTWAKNEFKVEVLIKVATNKEGGAKKMLDDVSVADGKTGSTVWFKTKFAGDQGSGSWSLFSGKKSVRIMEINYTIFMPAKNALTITNRYGSTELPDLYGKVIINNSYGNLTAKNLSNPANDINIKYGSATIQGLSGCDVNVAYGSLTLVESEKVNANVSYGGAKIGSVKTSGVFNVKYGSGLNIGSVDKNLISLLVNSSYSGVKVSMPESLNLDFDVTVHYGSFNYNDNSVVNVANKNTDEKGYNPTKNFKGSVGKGNSDKVIVIKSNYGSVKFE